MIWTKDEFIRATTLKNSIFTASRNEKQLLDIDKALDVYHKDKKNIVQEEKNLKLLQAAIQAWLDYKKTKIEAGKSRRSAPVYQLLSQAEQRLQEIADALKPDTSSVKLPSQFIQHRSISKVRDELENDIRKKTMDIRRYLCSLTFVERQHVRKSMISLVLEKKLKPEDYEDWFCQFAILTMLIPPDGSTDQLMKCVSPAKVKAEVIRVLSPMVINKEVVWNLLKNDVYIAVVPKNRYMTDLSMFGDLKDTIVRGGGRVWRDTRGVGNVAPKSGPYKGKAILACTEENLLGHNIDPTLKRHKIVRTPACPPGHVLDSSSPRNYYQILPDVVGFGHYDEFYSTTTHEFAHIVHLKGLNQKDRDLITHHYKRYDRGIANEDLGNRVWKMPTGKEAGAHKDLMMEIRSHHKAKTGETVQGPSSIKGEVKKELIMGWEWVDGPVGLTNEEIKRRQEEQKKIIDVTYTEKENLMGMMVEGSTITEKMQLEKTMHSVPAPNSPRCYASGWDEEYFAQLSNCWLESNAGKDPYTHQPRKNSQEWVCQNEPKPITDLLKKLYGEATIPNTNPRSHPL